MKKIVHIVVLLLMGCNVFGQASSENDLKRSIDTLFESYGHYNRFVGSVLISKDDNIVYQKSFGYANLEMGRKNTEHTIFSIASVTKAFTGVAIMKLVEENKISLETPISNFFPNFLANYSKDITIRHLLNHSSGMQANIGRKDEKGEGFMPDQNPIAFQEILDKFKDSKLKFEPGKGYEYNNFGFLLLAHIIEKVSGQPYADYLDRVIFKPVGMKNSASTIFKNAKQSAIPYTGLGMGKFEAHKSPVHSSWILGAGDIKSTTIDLYKFMNALESGSLLQPESVEKLYNVTQPMEMNAMRSGLGWVIDQKSNEKWIYHTGLLPGYTSIIGMLPERNLKIIILSNATSVVPGEEFQGEDQFVSGEITDKIISLFQGKSIETLPMPVRLKNDFITKSPKRYKLDNDHDLLIKYDGKNHWLEMVGKASWSIFTYAFSRDVKVNNKAGEIGLFFAEAMKTQKFEGLADYANEDMKGFLGSEKGTTMLKGIWGNFIDQFGEFKSYNIYNIDGDEVKQVNIRFHFDKNDVGIVLSIDKAHKIQGMFNDNAVKTSHVTKVKLIPIGDNEFFINGHKNGGFQDLRVKLIDDELLLIDSSKTFKAKLVPLK